MTINPRPLGDALRLQVEDDPVAGRPINLVPNPNGELGGFGWVTPAVGSAMEGYGAHLLGEPPIRSLRYNPHESVSPPQPPGQPYAFHTVDLPPSPGRFMAAYGRVPQAGTPFSASFDFWDDEGFPMNWVGMPDPVDNDGTPGTFTIPAFGVPSNAARMRFTFDPQYGGEPPFDEFVWLDQMTVAVADTAAALAGLGYVEPHNYVDVLGTTHDISVHREGLNVGTLTAHIVDSTLDPTQSGLIRPGRACRLIAYDDAVGDWRAIFTGTTSHATVDYKLTRADDSKRAEIELAAVDNTQRLANQRRGEGVQFVEQLAYVLDGTGVPWNLNGSGSESQLPFDVVSTSDSATALDEVAITRDTELGLAWVNRLGVLYAISGRGDLTPVASLGEADYTDVGVSYDTQSLLNELTLTLLNYDADAEETTTETTDPYRDETSIATWGVWSANFTVNGIPNDPPTLTDYATQILNANSTPTVRLNTMRLPVIVADDWSSIDSWFAWVELMDVVGVTCDRANFDDEPSRVVAITHTISAPDSKWLVDLAFEAPDRVVVPSTGGAGGSGGFGGSTGGSGTGGGTVYAAGAGLSLTGNTFDVNVDNVGVEIAADALRLKDGGVTSAKIADGTVALGDLSATGARDASKFLRGDNTWAALPATGTLAGVGQVGEIAIWGTSVPPSSWLLCNGASLLRADYADLFAVIGTTYGTADGTHFNLPNLQDRFPLGAGALAALAVSGGVTSHSHGLADHSHYVEHSHATLGAQGATLDTVPTTGGQSLPRIAHTHATGGASQTQSGLGGVTGTNSQNPAALLPPFLGINYVIRYQATPAQPGVIGVQDEGASVSLTTSLLNFVGAGVTAADAGGGKVNVTVPGGVVNGLTFYPDPTAASDIATYKKLLAAPSPASESTLTVACTGTGDVLLAAFASDPGVPGAVDYPAGTAARNIYAMVSAGTARLHLQVFVRNAAGVETLARDEYSPTFANTTVTLQNWIATQSAVGSVLATDRLVVKLFAQRVAGSASINVTAFFDGSAHASSIQTTIAAGLPVGAAGGDLAGTYPNPSIGVGKVTSAHIADGTVVDADVAAANKDGTAATPSLRTLGTGAQQAAAGNDARIVGAAADANVLHKAGAETATGRKTFSGGDGAGTGAASADAVVKSPSSMPLLRLERADGNGVGLRLNTFGVVDVLNNDGSGYNELRAGNLYDNNQRVYSSNNPPPATAATVLPVNAWVKEACRVCYVGTNDPLFGAPNAVDGVTLAVGDRVLKATPGGAANNGIYVVSTVGTGTNGAWTRAGDANATAQLAGAKVAVTTGPTYGGARWATSWKATDTLGTTAMYWAQEGLNAVRDVLDGGNYTIPSGSTTLATATQVPNLSVAIVVSSATQVWLAEASIYFGLIAGDTAVGDLTVDGVADANRGSLVVSAPSAAGFAQTPAKTFLLTGLSVGAHTIGLKVWHSGPNGTVLAQTNSSITAWTS